MDLDKSSLPIIIPTFNQPSLLRMTMDQFKSFGIPNPIVICDNNSTYQPMKDLLLELSESNTVVVSLNNFGPRVFTEDIQIMELLPDYYIVTDPDLIYNNELPSNFIDEMKSMLNRNKLAKIGFALDIEDDKENFLNYDAVYEWENLYWNKEIDSTSSKDTVYEAWIDTTFSLNKRESCIYYKKFGIPTFRYPSARIAGKYTAKHIGWWKKELSPQPREEIDYYLNTQKWSHTENYYYKGQS